MLVAGISTFRRDRPNPDNIRSARRIRARATRATFTWLVSDEILEEYRDVLRRLRVRRATIGRVLNLLAERENLWCRNVSARPSTSCTDCGGNAATCISGPVDAFRAEHRQLPGIRRLIVPDEVCVTVVSLHREVPIVGREPRVHDVNDDDTAVAENQRSWRLLAAVTA